MRKFWDYIWSSWTNFWAFHLVMGLLVAGIITLITVIYGYGTRATEITAAVLVPSYLILVWSQYMGKKRSSK